MKRILTTLKMLVAKIDILETMTPLEFLAFRERLEAGSGFQSAQFRELEFVLGHKRRALVENFPAGSNARARLLRRFNEPTLWDSFVRFIDDCGFAVPGETLKRDITAPVVPSPAMQAALIQVYRSDPSLASLCERMVDLDEGMQEWRYRHVKMVERTIGTKRGTGGTEGAEYLRTTLMRPLFPDLWAIRTAF
jgi:tryptophan 2,3-dioxygenase